MVTTLYGGRGYLWDVASGVQLAALPNPPPASAVTHVLLGRDLKSWLVGRGQGVSVVDLNPTSWVAAVAFLVGASTSWSTVAAKRSPAGVPVSSSSADRPSRPTSTKPPRPLARRSAAAPPGDPERGRVAQAGSRATGPGDHGDPPRRADRLVGLGQDAAQRVAGIG